MTAVTCRLLTEADLDAVSALHLPLYPRRSSATLRWQFFHDRLPAPGIVVGAFDGDTLIGTQGYIPAAASLNGEPLLTAKSELTLVDAKYRGQGIFDRMYELGFERCRQAGVACVWGFTSAAKPFRQVGFSTIGPTYAERIVWSPLALTSYARGWKTFAPTTASVVDDIDISLPIETPGFRLINNAARMRYRYQANPHRTLVYVDAQRHVAYSAGGDRPYFLFASEAPSLAALADSVRHLPAWIKKTWVGVSRFCIEPGLNWRSVPGTLSLKRPSANVIVFRWLRPDRALPDFAIEEGYTEGV